MTMNDDDFTNDYEPIHCKGCGAVIEVAGGAMRSDKNPEWHVPGDGDIEDRWCEDCGPLCWSEADGEVHGPFNSREDVIESVKDEMAGFGVDHMTVHIGPMTRPALGGFVDPFLFVEQVNDCLGDDPSVLIADENCQISLRAIHGDDAQAELAAAFAPWAEKWVAISGVAMAPKEKIRVQAGPGDEGWEEEGA